MKKIFTVLVALGSFVVTNAQSHNGNNSYGKNDERRYNDSYSFTARERDEQIFKINNQYDAKIRAFNMERFMKERKKRKEIAKIEFERSQMIRDINAKFADRRNRFSDTYAYGSHHDRH